MEGIKLKAVRLGRVGALAGASVAVAGLSLLGGAVAHAAVGSSPGQLSFNPASGALTTVPTWSTTTACPAAEPFATLKVVDAVVGNDIFSPIVNGSTPITNAPLQAGVTMASIESTAGYTTGQTAEAFVACSSGNTGAGTIVNDQSIFITFAATTYTTSATGPVGPVTPVVTLTATPNPVQVGNTVNLTATVMNGSTPVTAGSVQFQSGGTAIGTPVALSASGVATTTTTFTTAATDSLTAAFQSSNTASFSNATSPAVSEVVSATNPNANSQLITVSVAPTGSFTFSGTANATAALTESGNTATGTMVPVSVTDTRNGLAPNASIPSLVNGFNGYPGWSVVGQATDFTDPTSQPAGDIPVANFNWTPTTPATGDFTLGTATTTGLGTAQTLASAATGHGNGTFSLGSNLSLNIPTTAPAGAYTSTLTLTANPTANFH